MKVKNLCIASIVEIEKIEETDAGIFCAKTVEVGKSVFYQIDPNHVREVRTGKNYPNAMQTKEKINTKFVKNLDFETVVQRLKEMSYHKEVISKRKTLKMLDKLVEVTNEKSV